MEKIKIRINIMLILLTFILAVMQVLLQNHFSTSGDKLMTYEKEIKEISQENDRISQQIASVSAMNIIYQRAEKLSLNKSIPLFSLTSPVPIAYNIKISF